MPRNPHVAASTLRNRNRITNKTRLKVYQGPLDADALHIADEDEDRHQFTHLVAGVDAEDANEHHLQEILSAVHRSNINNRANRGASEKPSAPAQAAFIPTPDSTGVVDNYDELYSSKTWKDPVSYVSTSQTVEDHIAGGIADGCVYYMDERDKEWIDKNNEQARGEGTSAQGALSTPSTRTSTRSLKAKGKEPETLQPVVISEDEFELVMGVFEKVTRERTEFLHHGLETGMEFPAFLEYQDVFSAPLPGKMFSTHIVPSWIPAPAALLKIAKSVYGHWKERKLERKGHFIIPTLNGDESDTLNESYICFRRRETKAIRKTRSSQATSSDKLLRLRAEFAFPLEMAKLILARESLKKGSAIRSQAVWEKRLAFADLKRKFPSLHDKTDEELLVDKDRSAKRSDLDNPRLGPTNEQASPARPEPAIRPKDRQEAIRKHVELIMDSRKEIDHLWDDQVDNPYQPLVSSNRSKLFQYIPPPETSCWPSSKSDNTDDGRSPSPQPPTARAVRLRRARLGRMFLDRRDTKPRPFSSRLPRSSLFVLEDGDIDMDVDEDVEEVKIRKHQEEKWKYDMDDGFTHEGSDEEDRVLVDDYDPTYLRHAMTLYAAPDHWYLLNNPTISVPGPKGGLIDVNPFRSRQSPQHPLLGPDAQGAFRTRFRSGNGALAPPVAPPNLPLAAASVTSQHESTQIQPPTATAHVQISSKGGMQPPSAPASDLQSNGAISHHASPSHPVPVPISQISNAINGVSRVAVSVAHINPEKTEFITTSAPQNGVPPLPQSGSISKTNGSGIPVRPISQNGIAQSQIRPIASMNNYHLLQPNATPALSNSPSYQRYPSSLSPQQMQHLHTIFSNMPPQEFAAFQAGYGIPVSYNVNLKPPHTAHQMQWTNSPMQTPTSVVNGVDVQSSPNLAQGPPLRPTSSNLTPPGTGN